MGGSHWSNDHYDDRVAHRAATHTPTFVHTAAVAAGTAKTATHETLDPKLLKNGVREARDSDAHPNSKPVIVGFDVTGSMQDVPKQLQRVLPKLMTLLVSKNYVVDPQLLMAAIGDYNGNTMANGRYIRSVYGDKSPLQVGQFESGIEIDNDLTNIHLEGGGGGQSPPQESYQLLWYFAARHTAFDAWEKRGQKGYLITIGDEQPYAYTSRSEILDIFGERLETDEIATAQLLTEVQQRWELFHIIPTKTYNGRDPKLELVWRSLIGQERVLKIDDAELICEMIGSTIGIMEGSTDQEAVVADLHDVGTSAKDARKVAKNLDGVSKVALARRGTVGTTKGDTESTERL